MNSKILSFALLTAFLVLSFASADSSVLSFQPTSLSLTGTPGSSIVVPFNVSYTGTSTSAVLDFVLTEDPAVGKWTGLPAQTPIAPNEVKSFSTGFSIPAYASGTISTAVVVKVAGTTAVQNLPITINLQSSASLLITEVTKLTRAQNGKLTVKNTGNVAFTSSSPVVLTASGALPVVFSDNNFALAPGASKDVTVSLVDPNNFNTLRFGPNSLTYTATSGSTTFSLGSSITQSFCRNGPVGGNLSIRTVNINSDGSDDTIWKPLDKVSVEVEVENIGNDNAREVTVEFALFDSNGKNVANDLEFTNLDEKKINLGTINDGDQEKATFEFQVPADIDSGRYSLAVKAYSKKVGETLECTDSSTDLDSNTYQSIDVEKQDDKGKYIAFDNIKLDTLEVTCGDTVTLSTDVFNVGEDDQDRVKVNLRSKDLKLDASQEITKGLNQGEKESVSFTFTIPAGLSSKSYTFYLTSSYDYRSGIYRQESDDESSLSLKVSGCTGSPITGNSIAGISASLDSSARAGQELVVSSTIKNLGSTQQNFLVGASGFDSWAELNSISDRILTLNAGESKSVTFKFNVNSGVSGEKSFLIETQSGDQTQSKEVVVNVEKSTQNLFGGNSLVWIVAAINIILVLVIIIVAVRVSRR